MSPCPQSLGLIEPSKSKKGQPAVQLIRDALVDRKIEELYVIMKKDGTIETIRKDIAGLVAIQEVI